MLNQVKDRSQYRIPKDSVEKHQTAIKRDKKLTIILL